ncbi:hypothetical protein RHECNPAF_470016 [Rhizobium etli CNPAF512]|nr:hypothetical protein RHECNPAF_470016 [Rhizobium etli CNPAF512]
MQSSDFVFVAGHADDVAHVVIVIVFVGCEEGIVVVVAFDLDIVVAHIRNVVAAGGVIGIFQRNQFDFGVFGIDFRDLVLFSGIGDRRGFLEEGQGVGLAGIRRNDRIPVQIIELLAGFRIGALGSKFRFRHYKPRENGRIRDSAKCRSSRRSIGIYKPVPLIAAASHVKAKLYDRSAGYFRFWRMPGRRVSRNEARRPRERAAAVAANGRLAKEMPRLYKALCHVWLRLGAP